MKDSEVLKAAKALIEKPECWIQGRQAVTRSRAPTNPKNKNAVAFCSLGAVSRVSNYSRLDNVWSFLRESAFRMMGYSNPVVVNDRGNHTTVMEMFDLAICMAECEEEAKDSGNSVSASSISQEEG